MAFHFARMRNLGVCRCALGVSMAGILLAIAAGDCAAQDQAAPKVPKAAKAVVKHKPVPKREPIYNPKADSKADIAAALKAATLDHKRVLIMYGGNWCSWCYKLHDLFKQDSEIATVLRNEFVRVMIDVDTQQKLMDHYVKKSEQHGVPFLTVLDTDGKVLINQETGALEDGPKHDPKKVKAFLKKWSALAQDADVVFAEGLAQAKRESKRVLFHVGAPWCGWCRVLDRFLRENESLFATDFINLKIDEDRMTNAHRLIKRLRQGKTDGIPWIAILDADGKTLATSDIPKTGNIGFPSAPEEIRHFMGMLRQTSQRTTPQQLAAIEKRLIEDREQREHARQMRASASSSKPST
jgi:thiol-disulfide isomerase/thioredoxin